MQSTCKVGVVQRNKYLTMNKEISNESEVTQHLVLLISYEFS